MANILLACNNLIDQVASWYGDADAGFPLANLADSKFHKVWRFSPGANANGASAKFRFPLSRVARTSHIALCRHNLGRDAQVRVRAGTARLDVDYRSENVYDLAITYGGGANGTRTNEFGVMESAVCPRIEHDRRFFTNGVLWSEDLTNYAWVGQRGAVPLSDGMAAVFEKGDPAITVASNLYQSLGRGAIYNDTYEIKVQARVIEGNGDFLFQVYDGASYLQSAAQTATGEWKWFTATIAITAAAPGAEQFFYVQKLAGRGVLQLRKFQLHRGLSNGKYRKTTDKRRYQSLGTIVEAAATNSLLHSAALDDAAWAKSNSSVSANSAVAPDGALAMDRVTATLDNGQITQNISAGGTTTRGASVIFRKGGTATAVYLIVIWFNGGVQQEVRMGFSAVTGAAITPAASGATLRASGVEELGNGYCRAYLLGTGTDAANTQVQTRLVISTASQYVDLWGFQNEANYVTTYIPTTTAAVTRTQDTANVSSSFEGYVLNPSQGTLYHEVMPSGYHSGAANTIAAVLLFSGTNTVRSRVWENGAAAYADFLTSTGVDSADAALVRSAVARSVLRYRNGDFALAVNGSLVDSSTASLPTIQSVNLMDAATSTSYLRRVALWPSGKSNDEVVSLSASGPSAIDYDSGWGDALQMKMRGDAPALWGHDYDVCRAFSARAVECVSVELYDPAKTGSSTPFEVGRLFIGGLMFQPGRNAEYGLADAWSDPTPFAESAGGRKFFDARPKRREVAFTFPLLTHAEGQTLHEIQAAAGISGEVLFLPDPDDAAECQRYGFVGQLSRLDPLLYPMFATRAMAFQIAKKR